MRISSSEGDAPDAGEPPVAPAGAPASRLAQQLGLADDELCTVLDIDALALISGAADDRPELPILLALCDQALAQVAATVLRRWLRSGPRGHRPLDRLLARDFAGFEQALEDLLARGLVLRSGG